MLHRKASLFQPRTRERDSDSAWTGNAPCPYNERNMDRVDRHCAQESRDKQDTNMEVLVRVLQRVPALGGHPIVGVCVAIVRSQPGLHQ